MSIQGRAGLVAAMRIQSDTRTAGSRIRKQIMIHGGSKIAATTGNSSFRMDLLLMAANLPAAPLCPQ
jgi:hypothetical protein